MSTITAVLPSHPHEAMVYFENCLKFETDCWDVHDAMANGPVDFVLLDVRSTEAFDAGHAAGAINLPHREINQAELGAWPSDTVFVVYCAGPHCNGADRAAITIARLGRSVKKMIGGVTGWLDEGFELVQAEPQVL